MINIRVHIHNNNSFIDDKVFVDIKLPFVPKKGDTLYLTQEHKDSLKAQAISSLDIAKRYAPKWFYSGSSNCKNPTEENLKDLAFDDALYVHCVSYFADSDIVHLEITD